MDQESKVAFIIAQAACANAEIAAMTAQNQLQISQGLTPQFGYEDFMAIQSTYYIGHNSVIEYLRS